MRPNFDLMRPSGAPGARKTRWNSAIFQVYSVYSPELFSSYCPSSFDVTTIPQKNTPKNWNTPKNTPILWSNLGYPKPLGAQYGPLKKNGPSPRFQRTHPTSAEVTPPRNSVGIEPSKMMENSWSFHRKLELPTMHIHCMAIIWPIGSWNCHWISSEMLNQNKWIGGKHAKAIKNLSIYKLWVVYLQTVGSLSTNCGQYHWTYLLIITHGMIPRSSLHTSSRSAWKGVESPVGVTSVALQPGPPFRNFWHD